MSDGFNSQSYCGLEIVLCKRLDGVCTLSVLVILNLLIFLILLKKISIKVNGICKKIIKSMEYACVKYLTSYGAFEQVDVRIK